jgi:hypothetical protein
MLGIRALVSEREPSELYLLDPAYEHYHCLLADSEANHEYLRFIIDPFFSRNSKEYHPCGDEN